MQAREIMTTDVISVSPESSVRHIAQVMLKRRISAVPVIGDDQRLLGMVSEGDLIQRSEIAAQRSSWWLGLLDSAEATARAYVKCHGKQAKDVMTTDVITIDEDTPLFRIAALLEEEQIKRVPVVKKGRVVGIVSRADLLKAVATSAEDQTAPGDEALRLAIMTRLREDAGFQHGEMSVTVSGGVVHLWGNIRSDAEKEAALVAVSTVRGVRGLVNHARVVGDASSESARRTRKTVCKRTEENMPFATPIEYVVEPLKDAWTVSLQGRHFGKYAQRRGALRAAVQDGRRVRERGNRIVVRVRSKRGNLRALSERLLHV